MELFLNILKWFFLLGGSFFLVTGGIGVLRMPDLFTRFHAASLTDTLGAGMILIGLMIAAGWTLITVKLIIILAFLLITGPTSAHALAKAAIHGGHHPETGNKGDSSSN